MDHDEVWEIELPDIDIPDDGGGFQPPEPPEPPRGGGGGGGPRAVPAGDALFSTHWTSLIAALVIGFFGLQSVAVVWLARSGMGDETSTLALAAVFIVAFTVVFIAGARFIGRHRR